MDLKFKQSRDYVMLIQIKIKDSRQILRYIRNAKFNINQLNGFGDYVCVNICQVCVYV
jgi:hypothetical protein